MTTVAATSSVLLSPVSWHTYASLSQDLGEQQKVQLIYDQGRLEIVMSPYLPPHEKYSNLLHGMVLILAEEFDLEIYSLGSTTLRRADLHRAVEPDRAYYIQHESLARGKQEFDFKQFPPPDLVIEVDITSPSIDKLPLYQALGIPEIWRYDEKNFYLYQLAPSGEYVLGRESIAFQPLPLGDIVPQLLQQSFSRGELAVLKVFRQWVKINQ